MKNEIWLYDLVDEKESWESWDYIGTAPTIMK